MILSLPVFMSVCSSSQWQRYCPLELILSVDHNQKPCCVSLCTVGLKELVCMSCWYTDCLCLVLCKVMSTVQGRMSHGKVLFSYD